MDRTTLAGHMLPLIALSLAALASDPRDALVDAYRDVPVKVRALFALETVDADTTGKARQELAEAALALPAGTEMEVLGFADAASVLWPPHVIPDGDRTALVSELKALPVGSGHHADLGAAMALAVAELSAGTKADLAIVVFESRFCNDPTDGSPYGFAGTTGCRQLRGLADIVAGADKLRHAMVVAPTLVNLGRADPTGTKAFLKVFGSGTTLSAQADGGWVPALASEVPYRKVEWGVDAEVAGLAPKITDTKVDGQTVTLSLDSGLKHLSLRLDSVSFVGEGLEMVSRKALLAPTGTVELTVVPPEPPLSAWPTSRELVLSGELTGTATLEPRVALSRLKVSPGKGVMSFPVSVTIVQRYGPPAWVTVLGALVGLGAVLGIWRRAQSRGADKT